MGPEYARFLERLSTEKSDGTDRFVRCRALGLRPYRLSCDSETSKQPGNTWYPNTDHSPALDAEGHESAGSHTAHFIYPMTLR